MAEDITAPTIAAFSFTPTTIDTSSNSLFITATIRVTDDLSGVCVCRLGYIGPTGVVRERWQNSQATANRR